MKFYDRLRNKASSLEEITETETENRQLRVFTDINLREIRHIAHQYSINQDKKNKKDYETKEDIACMATTVGINYAIHVLKDDPERLDHTMKRIDNEITKSFSYLTDVDRWINLPECITLLDIIIDETENENAVYEMGLNSYDLGSVNSFIRQVVTLLTPQTLLKKSVSLSKKFNNYVDSKLTVESNDLTVISATYTKPELIPINKCEYEESIYSAIPTLFGYKPWDVEQPKCIKKGDDICEYHIHTQNIRDPNNKTPLLTRISNFPKYFVLGLSKLTGALDEYLAEAEESNRAIRKALVEANESRLESEKKSNIFRVYMRPTLVDRVDQGEDPTEDDLQIIDTSILFSDIREFTNLSELMGEYDVARFLNSYLSKMSTVIKDYGEIDKLIGDSIMANFDSVDKSVNAGIRLLEELQIYNKERFENPERTTIHVRSGIGVHFGPVTMGNIGSPVSRYDYTLIGDSVNVASRIEGLTKRYGVDFLISDTAYDKILDSIDTENIRSLDIVRVKGRKNPVELYEVFSHEPDQIKQVKHQVQPYLNKAYEHYLNADVETANNIYRKLRNELPKHSSLKERCIDPAIDYLAKRSQWVLTKGLHKEANWNPIHEFKEK
jgi:class 3 adenylate cyclase